MTTTTDQTMPRWVYGLLASVAATIGLAASFITAKFFILGLERLEADNAARDVLIATGVLMILTELLAFGLSALLPTHQLRALRTKLIICGTLLLTFEVATIYITQVALMQTATATATATETRINGLQASIESRRAAAESLRANGKLQSASSNAWTRTLGAKALREALEAEQAIDPLTTELAKLQSEVRPNLTTVIGENGMLIYSVTRAFLISAMGLVMFAAAGALLRVSRPQPAVAAIPTAAAADANEVMAQAAVSAPCAAQATECDVVDTEIALAQDTNMPSQPAPKGKQGFRYAGISLATLAFTPMVAATVQSVIAQAPTTPTALEVKTTIAAPQDAAAVPNTSIKAPPKATQDKQTLSSAHATKGRVAKNTKMPNKSKVLSKNKHAHSKPKQPSK